ncbi:MAG: glycoside hydrolase family 31 protein [Gammaproteobacteria bacterium]
MELKHFFFLHRVGQHFRTERGLEVYVDEERLRVEVLRKDIVRLQISRQQRFDERPTFSTTTEIDAGTADFSITETAYDLRIATEPIEVVIRKAPFAIDIYRRGGPPILESHRSARGAGQAYGTLNDMFVVVRRCQPDDAIYGLGEKTGRFNRKGRTFSLWNTDVLGPDERGQAPKDAGSTAFDPYYISIPFFCCLDRRTAAAAGFFLDNTFRSEFDFSRPDQYRMLFFGGHYTEYVLAGPSLKAILEGLSWLIGPMPRPPVWALGHHQCRWQAYTHETLLDLATQYREREIPCDALWLDIDYLDGYRVFTWDTNRFPAPSETVSRLNADGFQVVTIIDPGVKVEPGYRIYEQGRAGNHFCKTEGGAVYTGQVWPGASAFPDFLQAPTQRWWAQHIAEQMSATGVAGIWNDMNEPATGVIDPMPMRFDGGRQSHLRHHNHYALLMALATAEGCRQAMPDGRPFVLSRAGCAGIQRYSANWLGDNFSRWDHLWMSMPMSMGLALSGQPCVGADVGGFAGHCFPELLVRWYQCAALTPFCRNHSATGTAEQYPWSFGPTVEALCRHALRMRYRLMPYVYAAFVTASESGTPIQRPLVYEFQADIAAHDIDDVYLFGEQMLVAPVYTPGQREREVYLPEGTWYHWHTGEIFHGPRIIKVAAPIHYIPVFARGGGIIPSWPTVPLTTAGYQPPSIDLHVFLPHTSIQQRSTLQEDDGLSLAYRRGDFRRTDLLLERDGRRFQLSASVTGNGFPAWRRAGFRLRFYGTRLDRVELNGRSCRLVDNTLILNNHREGFILSGTIV